MRRSVHTVHKEHFCNLQNCRILKWNDYTMISGINVPLSAMNAQAQKIEASAAKIAGQSTDDKANVTQELITVKAAEINYKANAKMINAIDDMAVTLLDMMDDD